MMRKPGLLFVAGALAFAGLAGCGDDSATPPTDGGGGGIDGGTGTDGGGGEGGSGMCAFNGGMGACCYLHSNAMATAMPEMRLVGLNITAPMALANPAIVSIVQNAIDQGGFNWLIRLTGAAADGPVTIETGAGTCSMGGATCMFHPMYPAQMFMGTIAGETWMAAPATGPVSIPVFGDDGVTLLTVLPLQGLTLNSATLSEMRSCIGAKSGRGWSYGTPPSSLTAYITVDDAKTIDVSALMTNLCALISGGSCEMPQSGWTTKPDALCTAGVCTAGMCDPATTCNAFTVQAQFAAAGVEIN